MKIKVTAEHIRNGECSADRCPIALALHSAGHTEATVFYSSVCLDGRGDIEVLLPEEAIKFIHLFDRREHVEPFEFEISLEATS
jgi:hypothetical protein